MRDNDNIVEAYKIIEETLGTEIEEITNWKPLKAGMTNSSYTFECHGKRYIIRIPGKGTEQLINREQEYNVYKKIRDMHISDNICYINAQNGYKISEFIPNARNCNCKNEKEVKTCMEFLRKVHSSKIEVEHSFDLGEKIDFYEELIEHKSMYCDYAMTKSKINQILSRISAMPKERSLAHIDAVPDNFLIESLENGGETIRLIDWEYAGMQDPHIDIAMFAIYSMYDKGKIDQLIDFYFEGVCDILTRVKIYGYIACCGLLWSNWCEYKHKCGINFGEYARMQYQYAKQYADVFERDFLIYVESR